MTLAIDIIDGHGFSYVHLWFARTAFMHFGLHEHTFFPTHFAYFIGVHSGLAYTQVRYRPKVTSHSLATLVDDTRILIPFLSRHWCTGTYKIYEGQGIEYPRIVSTTDCSFGLNSDSSRLIFTRVKQASDATE